MTSFFYGANDNEFRNLAVGDNEHTRSHILSLSITKDGAAGYDIRIDKSGVTNILQAAYQISGHDRSYFRA